jgi:predicted DNA-binding WGR domain protein
MSAYPMTVQKVYLEHVGGTKFYALTLIFNSNDKALFIRRWGRKGVFGDMIVEEHNTHKAGVAAYEKLLREKSSGRKGYEVKSEGQDDVHDGVDELRRVVGLAQWAKLSPKALKHIDPAIDTTGVREPDPPRFDENGDYLGEAPVRKVEITEEMVEADKRARMESAYSSNPKFGMF